MERSFYERYRPVIQAKCGRLLRDEAAAQDLAQETFHRFLMHEGALRNPEAAVPWLYRTANRLAIDWLRKRKVEINDPLVDAWSVDERAKLEGRDELRRLVATLTSVEIEVLILNKLDGLTQREIAGVMDMGSDRDVRRVIERVQDKLARLRERGDRR